MRKHSSVLTEDFSRKDFVLSVAALGVLLLVFGFNEYCGTDVIGFFPNRGG